VRPQVDAYLLDLLAARTFTAKDFVETRKGVCRVLAPLTHTLAETTTQWARAIAPVVENVAGMLASKSPSRIERLPTPLTQANRSSGRDTVRRKPTRPISSQTRRPAATCATCGGPLPNSERQFCDDCLPGERQQLEIAFVASGVAALAKMRAEGREPMDSAEVRRKLGEATAQRRREEIEWDRTHDKPDPAVFRREILPLLEGVSLRKMKAATGLSLTMCARVRRGYIPHPRHWEKLRGLAEAATP